MTTTIIIIYYAVVRHSAGCIVHYYLPIRPFRVAPCQQLVSANRKTEIDSGKHYFTPRFLVNRIKNPKLCIVGRPATGLDWMGGGGDGANINGKQHADVFGTPKTIYAILKTAVTTLLDRWLNRVRSIDNRRDNFFIVLWFFYFVLFLIITLPSGPAVAVTRKSIRNPLSFTELGLRI